MAKSGDDPTSNESLEEAAVIPDAKTLPDPPTDAISKLSFLPSSSMSSLLASTSWDGGLRLYDCDAMECKLSHSAAIGPLLSLAVVDEGIVFVGGLSGSILRMNISQSDSTSPEMEKVGNHSSSTTDTMTSAACSCLISMPSSPSLLGSAGWHGKFHLWDIRQSPTVGSPSPVLSVDLPGKAFSMDAIESKVVIGCSGRRTCLLDIRKEGTSSWTAETVLDAESSQKHQTRCVKFFPNGKSIAVGSIEGRVAVESVELETGDAPPSAMKKIYAFKCHRDGDLVYPVNCIDFHPKFGTFATGGCDGTVVTWDGANRKRLTSFKFPTSVASLCFNHDGSKMAVASSYTFEDGEREHPRDEIYIRPMRESDCAPKQVASSS